jgi:hypothetical protein
MPADDRLGFDDHQARAPARPDTGEPDPEDPVALAETRAFCRPMEDGQLLAQRQVFRGDHGPRHEKRLEKERGNAYNARRQASVWVL